MNNQKRIIKVTNCNECPFCGQCAAWQKLTKKQIVTLNLGVGIPADFMLAECHLEAEEDTDKMKKLIDKHITGVSCNDCDEFLEHCECEGNQL